MAVVGFVEPKSALQHRGAAGRKLLSLGGALRQELGDGALGVALDDAGAIGVGAVNEHLNLAVAQARASVKIRADANDAVDFVGEQKLPRPRHRCQQSCLEIRREWKPAASSVAVGRWASSTTATGTFLTSSESA